MSAARRLPLLLSVVVGTGSLVAAAGPAPAAVPPLVEVAASAETPPVASSGDHADDPAIWVDPTEPSRSLVIGTETQAALEVYDLSGRLLQRLAYSPGPNNVDVHPSFALGGRDVAVVAANGFGVMRFWVLDPATGRLSDASDRAVPTRGTESGVCLYRSRSSGRTYAFTVGGGGGVVEQYELFDTGGLIGARLVRGPWNLGSAGEGCAADDELGFLYVSEEDVGIWKYGAEPGDPTSPAARTLVDTVDGAGHLVPDVEGLTIVYQPGGRGYLLASAQNGSTMGRSYVAVYDRAGANTFLRAFRVVDGPTADGCASTDGIAAVAADLGPAFPAGLFVCQDGSNTEPGTSGNQNFKYVRLEAALGVDPGPGPDPPPPPPPPPPPDPEDPPPGPGDPGAPASPPPPGYWLVGADGRVFAFGSAGWFGDAAGSGSAAVVDVEATASGNGYWVVDEAGTVRAFGDAVPLGSAPRSDLAAAERVTSIAGTPDGRGYWLFTSQGRVLPFGPAPFLGDMAGVALNGPVLDSVVTPSGAGYYMVAADGGVFTFGDARFAGSMGGRPLRGPVRSLVPDGDGSGYWLVASDGGIFAFGAPFRGSMGGQALNAPVQGMVRYGASYLMVAADGGVFNFSDRPFSGSLGADPPDRPVVAVAAVP